MNIKEVFRVRPVSSTLLMFAVVQTPLMIIFWDPIMITLFVLFWIAFLATHFIEIFNGID
jgi:hypothetical protein